MKKIVGMKEEKIEGYLVSEIEKLGGETRKMEWIGAGGAPDRLIAHNGKMALVECKAPLGKLSRHQIHEIKLFRKQGITVKVIRSFAQVDEFIKWLKI